MSTRRARIKAVAALPPRRKNLENDAKNKSNTAKDNSEVVLKSPRTPRNQPSKSDDKNSPLTKSKTRSPPDLIPLGSASETPANKSVPSPKPVPTTEESTKTITAQTSEKVPVITPVSLIKNVFASPLVKGSPRRITSPIVPPSPKRRKISEIAASPVPPVVTNISESGSSQSNDKVIRTPTGGKKSDVPDDYSVPSVPESGTDDAEVDGIVLLQSTQKAAKPILELLKSEIISDYADVSFDPIVPLPSPSKVRPKLRPVPRLAPHRRNSIQGSASESEDESRRALLNAGAPTPVPPRHRHDSHTSHSTMHSLPVHKDMNRIRNDSVSSNISQVAVTQPPPATSPVKEKHFSKTRRHEMSRRSWLRRREVKRDALTMYDLIFYNPTTNPIIPDQEEINAKEANAKEEAERNAKAADSEEEVDDPPVTDAAPVPQIKIGPNGEIVLDEKSLVIKQSDKRKVSSVVREGAWGGGWGGRYSRGARTQDWSAADTVRFYRALAAIGTDFSLMAPLFPDRNRKDLYLKFKKEERLNGAQVDKALRSATSWDVTRLQTEFEQEREDAKKREEAEHRQFLENKKAERERINSLKETKIRNSRGSRALEFTVKPGARSSELTADDLADRALQRAQAAIDRSLRHKLSREPAKPALDTSNPSFATLTLLADTATREKSLTPTPMGSLATISRINPPNSTTPVPVNLNQVSGVPSNIETGSLVVLRVNDPKSPTKTMLQTYIAHGADKLTPVALPSTFLNSVVGYMKKGTPKSTISSASSPLMSPNSVTSQGSRSVTPSVIQLNPSPVKKKRHTSYTITPM